MNYRVEKIADWLVKKLGSNHYNLDINCNLNISGNVIQGIMFATRRPFKINNINAESLELQFEWFVSVRNKNTKLDVLKDLGKITGALTGSFEDQGKEYNFNTFIEFGRTTTTPIVDMGDYTQVVLMSGTCFVTDANDGALISNDIKTELYTEHPDNPLSVGGIVAVLSASTVLSKVVASPQKLNKNKTTTYCSTQSVTTTLCLLYLKSHIDNILIEHINLHNNENANRSYFIKRTFPTFVVTKECKISQASITENAGAFLQYEIVLQEV